MQTLKIQIYYFQEGRVEYKELSMVIALLPVLGNQGSNSDGKIKSHDIHKRKVRLK